MKLVFTIGIISFLMLSAACQKVPVVTAIDQMSTQELIAAAQLTAEKAQRLRGHGIKTKKRELALEGKVYAERCIEISPDRPGCYYWRAVNTGLYHSVKVTGYQKGIQQMIADCDKVIELGKEKYDQAGPYRIPGEIYTQLPQTAGRPDSIIQDLDKAEDLLRKAVALAPDYPENHLALAETLYKKDRFDEAMDQLLLAKEQAPQWRVDSSYHEWQKKISSLMKKIKRKQ